MKASPKIKMVFLQRLWMTWKKWLKAYSQRLKERSAFHHFKLIGEPTISRKYRVSFSSLSLKPFAFSLAALIHTDWRRAIKIFPLIISVFFLCSFSAQAADNYSVEAAIDSTSVMTGEEFSYTVTVKGSNVPEGLQPSVRGLGGDGIKLLGVHTTRSMLSGSSMTIVINGQIVKNDSSGEEQYSFEYSLLAMKPGSHKIGPAIVGINGVDYSSGPVSIMVSGASQPGTSVTPSGDIFVQAEAASQNLTVGQVLIVDYYFYFRSNVTISQMTNSELPEMDGFIRYNFDRPDKSGRISEIDLGGIRYNRLYLGRLISFPIRSGALTIEPLKQGYAQAVTTRNSFFPSYRQVEKFGSSQPIQIAVAPLPETGKPANFSGAVGSFSVSAGIDRTSVRAGESVTMSVTLTGSGNLQGAADPVIILPQYVESYPPEKDEKTWVDNNNLQWERTYRYILSPRKAGNIELGPVNFVYFNPANGQYEKAVSQKFIIDVQPGRQDLTGASEEAGSLKSEQKIGSDIRYIKPDAQTLRMNAPDIYRRGWFIALQVVPVMILGVAVMWRKKQDRLETDTAFARRTKSRDKAEKRIEIAGKEVGKNPDDFYRELFNAISGYIADRYNLPEAGMSAKDFRPHLASGALSAEEIDRTESFLDQCQSARFLPGYGKEADEQKLLQDAADILKSLARNLKEPANL